MHTCTVALGAGPESATNDDIAAASDQRRTLLVNSFSHISDERLLTECRSVLAKAAVPVAVPALSHGCTESSLTHAASACEVLSQSGGAHGLDVASGHVSPRSNCDCGLTEMEAAAAGHPTLLLPLSAMPLPPEPMQQQLQQPQTATMASILRLLEAPDDSD